MDQVFKGDLMIGGHTFIELLLEGLSAPFFHTCLVGNQPSLQEYQQGSTVSIHRDLYTGIGPLAGVVTAFQAVTTDYVFFCPCDTPFLSLAVVDRLFEERQRYGNEITVPMANDHYYPLIGFYRRTVGEHAQKMVEAKRLAIRNLFRECSTLLVYFKEQRPFQNINTWEEYRTCLKE